MLPSRPCDRCIFPTIGAACDFLSVFAVISDLLAKLVVSYDLYPTQGVTEALKLGGNVRHYGFVGGTGCHQ